MKKVFKFKGEEFIVEPSSRKNKQLVATFKDKTKIHFGDPDMPEYPSTKRGDRYCTRSKGISSKGIKNANTLSRKILWKCKEKKSMDTFKEAGLDIIKREDFFDSL